MSSSTLEATTLPAGPAIVEARLVRWYFYAALTYLFLSMSAGLLVALQLVHWNPLQGIHHFLYTPIPMFLQYGAVISTIAVELVVATVVIDFMGTLRGRGRVLAGNLPIR